MNKDLKDNAELITNILCGRTDVQSLMDESTWGVDKVGPFKLEDYSKKDEDGDEDWDEEKLEAACEKYFEEVDKNYDITYLFQCLVGSVGESSYCFLEDKKNKNGYTLMFDTEMFYGVWDFCEDSSDKACITKSLIDQLLDGAMECLYRQIWLNPDYLPKKDFLKMLKDGEKGWPDDNPPIEEWIEQFY